MGSLYDDADGDPIGQHAYDLSDEIEGLRGRIDQARAVDVLRAAELVHVTSAAEVAARHGRPILAWMLRRFEAKLRR